MVTVVHVMGASFSGTTLLSYLLGSHPQIRTLGEIMCWFCWHREPPAFSGFYSKETVKGILPGLARCALCGKEPCPAFPGDLPARMDPRSLYATMAHRLASDVLVDSSKHPTWYERTIEDNASVRHVAVLLHKPVWGIVASRARYMKLAHIRDIPRDRLEGEVRFWRYFYSGFRDILRQHDLPGVNVRYEDLARQPRETLKRVLAILPGIPASSQAVEAILDTWWRRPPHQVSGNGKLHTRIAMGAVKGIRYDTWQDTAPKEIRDACLSMEGVHELMEWLGR